MDTSTMETSDLIVIDIEMRVVWPNVRRSADAMEELAARDNSGTLAAHCIKLRELQRDLTKVRIAVRAELNRRAKQAAGNCAR